MMTACEPDRIVWRTSSYSYGNGDCVQVGWRTSSYSGGNGACVQVVPAPNHVLLRDSKNPTGPALTIPTPAWRAFLTILAP
jgi:hypothetical protein